MTDNYEDLEWFPGSLIKAAFEFEYMQRPLQSWGASPLQYIADAHRAVKVINDFTLGQDSAMQQSMEEEWLTY